MRKGFLFIIFALLLIPNRLYAELSSTNYKAELKETGGGGSSSSSSYSIAEGEIDWGKKDLLTSTSYKVEGQVGISSGILLIPEIQSVTPSNYSRFFTDGNASFTVQARDPDNDPLQYQAKQDGTVKVAFQSSSTLTYALSASDKGRHAVKFEVKDNDGTVAAEQAMYAFRKPVK